MLKAKPQQDSSSKNEFSLVLRCIFAKNLECVKVIIYRKYDIYRSFWLTMVPNEESGPKKKSSF